VDLGSLSSLLAGAVAGSQEMFRREWTADLIVATVPVNLEALDTALDQFLATLKDVGQEATGWWTTGAWSPALLGLATGLVTYELGRRMRLQRQQIPSPFPLNSELP
jgi:hypothetical protein